MSADFPTVVARGAGTVSWSGSSTQCVSVFSATTQPWDLGLLVCVANGDILNTKDAGDGWVILAKGYDASTTKGIFLAVTNVSAKGTATMNGLTFPSAYSYGSCCNALYMPQPYFFDVANARGDETWFYDAATNTIVYSPTCSPSYSQCVDVIAWGSYRGSASCSWTSPTGFTNLASASSTTPNLWLGMDFRTVTGNPSEFPVVSGTLSRTEPNRMSVRATIGLVGCTSRYHLLSRKRIQ